MTHGLCGAPASGATQYANEAQIELARVEIDDWDVAAIRPYLEDVRLMPAGFGNQSEETLWNGFGLRQIGRISTSAERSYADALEKMFRPRLVLDVERRLPELRNAGDPAEIYRALKVYMLLAGLGPSSDDDAIKAWFADIWDAEYGSFGDSAIRDNLKLHLANMLELDDTRTVSVQIDNAAVSLARSAIVQMSLADQAYAIIRDKASQSSLPPFSLASTTGREGAIVFSTTDGSDFSDLTVPGLYTFDGYWFFFLDQVLTINETLENDKWVLGDQADAVSYDAQLAGLAQAVQRQYARDFEDAWFAMLGRIQMNNMSGDPPQFNALGTAGVPFTSPLERLAKAVSGETKLTRFLDELSAVDPTSLGAEGVGADVGGQLFSRFTSTSGGLQRILLEAASNSAKSQNRVGGGGDQGPRRDAEQIEDRFEVWHQLVEGDDGARAIDVLTTALSQIQQNRRLAAQAPGGPENQFLPGLLSDLTRYNSSLPPVMATFLEDVKSDFETQATDADIAEMNRQMSNNVAYECRQSIEGYFPFDSGGSVHVSPRAFEQFFGPSGTMQNFYDKYLSAHVDRTPDGLRARPDSVLADRLSANMLLQFTRAQEIQRAFFASGEQNAEVRITLSPRAIQSDLKNIIVGINGVEVELIVDGAPQTITWPGPGDRVTLRSDTTFVEGTPPQTREWAGGAWSIINFIQGADSRVNLGNGMRLRYSYAQRPVEFDLTFSTNDNPFTLPEIQQFSCPQTVD